jgi:hypothetical protein
MVVEQTVKQSTVTTLKGILKKPRRFSKEWHKSREQEVLSDRGEGSVTLSNPIEEGVIPEISSQHSDEKRNSAADASRDAPPSTPDRRSLRISALQIAALDRVLFAKRGAELRDQYMRDLSAQAGD